MKKPRILMAMSGGVDSSVAAALLIEQGYEVVGVFMKNWSGCDWKVERRDAMRVASQLGIPLVTRDFENEYRERVYEYMIAEYEAGRTPNPDVLCNSEVKFDLLLKVADELDCAFLATGHYARVNIDDTGAAHLLKGIDDTKDQSYFLCRLTQDELQRALFPIGHLEKPEVRRRAEALGLTTAQKKDSQGLCFIGKVDMPTFLKERIKTNKGSIVTTEGKVIGEHEGIQFYTIGQRKGLGIGGGVPYFVVERRIESNELVVAVGEDDPALFHESLEAVDVQWTGGVAPGFPLECSAKIRYRQEDQESVVELINHKILVKFKQPQRAVAPGQFVVFYNDDELVGSAVIQAAR